MNNQYVYKYVGLMKKKIILKTKLGGVVSNFKCIRFNSTGVLSKVTKILLAFAFSRNMTDNKELDFHRPTILHGWPLIK